VSCVLSSIVSSLLSSLLFRLTERLINPPILRVHREEKEVDTSEIKMTDVEASLPQGELVDTSEIKMTDVKSCAVFFSEEK